MISSKPSISLVIPSYNRAHLIVETLSSAVRQTSPFSEIIVIDDGSTDDTQSVIAYFGRAVVYRKTENGGVQRARNLGAEMANSAWVAFCDSDDLLKGRICRGLMCSDAWKIRK